MLVFDQVVDVLRSAGYVHAEETYENFYNKSHSVRAWAAADRSEALPCWAAVEYKANSEATAELSLFVVTPPHGEIKHPLLERGCARTQSILDRPTLEVYRYFTVGPGEVGELLGDVRSLRAWCGWGPQPASKDTPTCYHALLKPMQRPAAPIIINRSLSNRALVWRPAGEDPTSVEVDDLRPATISDITNVLLTGMRRWARSW